MSNIGLTEAECREIAEETRAMSDKPFRTILADWMGEMQATARGLHPDGTPIMGKFETEELFRQGKKFLEAPQVEPHFHKLTPAQAERVYMLAEEAAEVVQTCMKVLRHGYASYNPDDDTYASNGDQLENELMDLWTVYERMADYGDLRRLNFFDTAKRWVKKLKYAHHQPAFHHPLDGKPRPSHPHRGL